MQSLKRRETYVVLLASSSASFLTPFMGSAINVALPEIAREFQLDALTLNWVATAFLLSAAMFLLPVGRIADIKGRRKVFTVGICIVAISSIFCSISTSGIILVVSRFFQGVGSAMIFGTATAIVSSVFPPQERGKALGINVAAVYLGLSLGPLLGGFLTQNFGWRSIFIAVFLPSFIALATISTVKGEWAEAKGERPDFAGSVLYALSLFLLIYGFSIFPEALGKFLLFTGILCLTFFVVYESQVRFPALNMSLFRKNRVFLFSNLAALISYSATFAVGFLLSLYLQYIRSLTPQEAGIVLVAQPSVMAIISPLAGWLSDRVEPRVVASLGVVLITLTLTFFTFLDENTPIQSIVVLLSVMGFGFALFSSPNTNAIMGSVERKFYSVASATLGTMRLLGQMFSMGIVMIVFTIYMGKIVITPDVYWKLMISIKLSFLIFSSLCFVGVLVSVARGKVRKQD
jgi:EmrB/QacA subfamily drug resistance transporter